MRRYALPLTVAATFLAAGLVVGFLAGEYHGRKQVIAELARRPLKVLEPVAVPAPHGGCEVGDCVIFARATFEALWRAFLDARRDRQRPRRPWGAEGAGGP